MKYAEITAFLFLVSLLTIRAFADGSQKLPVFFNQLYEENKARIKPVLLPIAANGLKKTGLNAASLKDEDKILRIMFFHLLFTSTNAVDCTDGGILNIPYFWHWVNPNPRHALIYLPTSKPLIKTKAPEAFSKYHSYADVDRTPSLYMSNLVTDSPLFSHPKCGRFFTFGWCSEREMAFSNLLSLYGYKVKIKQEGIHVWSEVLVDIQEEKEIKKIILTVDNTFNVIDFRMLKASETEWLQDLGTGAQVLWYNRKALSPDERQKVKSISVSTEAVARISGLVNEWLNRSGK